MSKEVPNEPIEKVEQIANETIQSLDSNMNATIEGRTIMPFVGNEYDATVLRFTHSSDPSMEWTMDVNKDPEYVEGKLPEVIKNVYEEKDGQRNDPVELNDSVFEELFLKNKQGDTSPNEDVDAITEARASIDKTFSDISMEGSSTSISSSAE